MFAVYVASANGASFALPSAPLMHASAGLPAAPPVTLTLATVPADVNVIDARETASSGPRHARAPGRTAPIAPVTAPCEGFCGTVPAANCGPVLPAAGVASTGLPFAPTAWPIAAPRSPPGPAGVVGRSFAESFGPSSFAATTGLSALAATTGAGAP